MGAFQSPKSSEHRHWMDMLALRASSGSFCPEFIGLLDPNPVLSLFAFQKSLAKPHRGLQRCCCFVLERCQLGFLLLGPERSYQKAPAERRLSPIQPRKGSPWAGPEPSAESDAAEKGGAAESRFGSALQLPGVAGRCSLYFLPSLLE